MLLAFMVVVFGFVFPPISVLLAWMAHVFLSYEVWVIDVLSKLSWASIEVKNFSSFWVVVWYVILIFGVIRIKKFMDSRDEE
jgi:hypothetical protein